MATINLVSRENQQLLLTPMLLLHLFSHDMLAALLQAQLTQVLLSQPSIKVTSATLHGKPVSFGLFKGCVNVSRTITTPKHSKEHCCIKMLTCTPRPSLGSCTFSSLLWSKNSHKTSWSALCLQSWPRQPESSRPLCATVPGRWTVSICRGLWAW